MKKLMLAGAICALPFQAMAGALIFEAPVEDEIVVVEPEAPMGGANLSWIVPVIALVAIGLAVSNSSSSGGSDEPRNGKIPDHQFEG